MITIKFNYSLYISITPCGVFVSFLILFSSFLFGLLVSLKSSLQRLGMLSRWWDNLSYLVRTVQSGCPYPLQLLLVPTPISWDFSFLLYNKRLASGSVFWETQGKIPFRRARKIIIQKVTTHFCSCLLVYVFSAFKWKEKRAYTFGICTVNSFLPYSEPVPCLDWPDLLISLPTEDVTYFLYSTPSQYYLDSVSHITCP